MLKSAITIYCLYAYELATNILETQLSPLQNVKIMILPTLQGGSEKLS